MKSALRIGPLTGLRNGNQAFQQVPGLKGQAIRAFLANLVIFIVVSLVLNGLLYNYLLEPWIASFFGSEDGFWATLGSVILWITQILVGALLAVATLLFSVSMMGAWHEFLVSQVIRHFRPLPDVPFNFGMWLGLTVQSAIVGFKEVLWVLLLIVVGFIPIVGPILAFIGAAYLMGRGIFNPYWTVLQEQKESTDSLKQSVRWAPIQVGLPQMGLAFVPILGWLAMPWVLLTQVLGVAYYIERQRSTQGAGS